MTLTQLFTAIADAIRSKKGTSAAIAAENFPSEIESISGGSSINLFIQDDQPDGYDGIWIADSTYANYPIIEVADTSSLVANSINIIKKTNNETILYKEGTTNLRYLFGRIIITDTNNDIVKIPTYYGDGSQWIDITELGHTELQHIQSNGTQYINTNVSFDNDTIVEGRFKFNSTTSKQCFIGMDTSNNNGGFCGVSLENGNINAFCNANNVLKTNTSITDIHDFIIQGYNVGRKVQIDDKTGTAGNISVSRPLYVFRFNSNNSGTTWYANANLYYLKIYKSNELVRDFIPVKYNDEVCLYDKVSKEYFYNAGSGSFIAGPEA